MNGFKALMFGGEVPPRNVRYYVDIGLVPVVLVSLVLFLGSVWSWPPSTWSTHDTAIGTAIVCVGLLLARERRVVLGAALGYLVLRSLFGIASDSKHAFSFAAIAASGALALLGILWPVRTRRADYDSPNTHWDIVVFCGFFATVIIALFFVVRDALRFYFR